MTEIGDVARLSRWIGESNVCGLLKGVQMSCAAVHPGHRLSPVAEPSMLRLIEFVVERVMRVACRTRETQLSANVIVIQSEDIKRGCESLLLNTELNACALREIDCAVLRCKANECEHPELWTQWSPYTANAKSSDFIGTWWFPPGPVAHLALRLVGRAHVALAPHARIALAAAVEYLVCEILELSGHAQGEMGPTAAESIDANEALFASNFNLAALHVENIDPALYNPQNIYWHREWMSHALIGCVHVQAAVVNDPELSTVFWWIDEFKAQGGVRVPDLCARAKSRVVELAIGFASLALPVLVLLEIADHLDPALSYAVPFHEQWMVAKYVLDAVYLRCPADIARRR
jgi:hypothetical protein